MCEDACAIIAWAREVAFSGGCWRVGARPKTAQASALVFSPTQYMFLCAHLSSKPLRSVWKEAFVTNLYLIQYFTKHTSGTCDSAISTASTAR